MLGLERRLEASATLLSRKGLERAIGISLLSAPVVPDNDGKLIRVKTLVTPASILREWQNRPRMTCSPDRLPQEEYQEALRSVPWFQPRYELQYDEPSFHDLASLVLSSRPSGLFGQSVSAELDLVHISRPEIWSYGLSFEHGGPLLRYWALPRDETPVRRGEHIIRARPCDIEIFAKFLAASIPAH